MKLQVTWKILTIVFLLAFAVRLLALNQSLWLDEATSARVASSYSLMEITGRFSVQDFHPPLHYLFLNVWSTIFGNSEISLRFPSILFSLLTGWVIYLIGRELKNKKAGLYASIFFLFNPLIVYYSQEARMYMMVTSFLTLATYYILRVYKSSRKKIEKRDIVLGNIFIAWSLFTFYGSIFFILSVYLYLILNKEKKTMLLFLPGFLLGLVVLFPLLWLQLANSKEFLQMVPNWVDVLGKANLKNLLLIPVKFVMGRISFEPKPLYYTVAIFWTSYVFYIALRKAKQHRFLLFLFFAPLMLGFLFSLYKPLLQYFRFIYLIPILSLLLAFGTKNRPQRIRILLGFLFFTFVYLFNPSYHREDWKGLATALEDVRVVYMIPSSSDPIHYYNKYLAIKDVRDFYNPEMHREDNVMVIPYTTDIYGFDYAKILEEQGFKKEVVITARGVHAERWRKKF